MIKLQNVSKKFGSTVIFENTSFSFPDKGLVCVLGPSGSGKSTLLNLIAGFDSEYEGDIAVHGSSLSKMDASQLCAYRRDNIGFVFQNYHLISGYTVMENILLASDAVGENRAESEAKAKELLRKLGLSGKEDQKAETLSGGEKQRTAIARALINEPSIIFADEPTGALDRKNSDEIMELLKSLSESRLVLVITHDKKCADYADRTVTISDGKLLGSSPQSEETAVLKTKEAPKLSLKKRAGRNFRLHLARYMAVALAISIGVLCFILSLSSGNRMDQEIADFERKNTAYHNGYIKAEGNETELLKRLSDDQRIENVYAQYVLKDISIKSGDQSVDMPEWYPLAKTAEQMSYGVMPRRGENEIAVSPSLAAKFDKNIQNFIGKTVELTYDGQTYSLTVSGIFNGVYDNCFVSSDIEQKMSEGLSGDAYSVSYDVIRFEEIVSVSEELKADNVNSQNASAEVAAFQNTFRNINRLFFTVSLLIFAIGIFISVVLLVKQQNMRYREVGLLSALGYTKGSIRKILLFENLGLSGLAVLCSMIMNAAALIAGRALGISLLFSGGQILFTLCLTAVLILVISLVSSTKLLNTEPAEALRK